MPHLEHKSGEIQAGPTQLYLQGSLTLTAVVDILCSECAAPSSGGGGSGGGVGGAAACARGCPPPPCPPGPPAWSWCPAP